jgi:23S rRNA (uracil1939-C5)-methyltransferase
VRARELVVRFEKIVPEGKSLGRHDGKVVFAWGVAPSETARVRVLREKRTFIEAELVEVLEGVAARGEAREGHWRACSPWQPLAYPWQVEAKRELLASIHRDLARAELNVDRFVPAEETHGYRTKIEFSLVDGDGGVSLAFHRRGEAGCFETAPDGCVLASDAMNRAAIAIARCLGEKGVRAHVVKSLVLRESKREGGCVAVLYVTERGFRTRLPLSSLPGLDGLVVAYSDPRSPVSVATEVIAREGRDFLEERILGTRIRYASTGFFQNHIPVFESAVSAMREAIPERVGRLVELYAGVGTIGLALADAAEEILAVESDAAAMRYAEHNRAANRAGRYVPLPRPVEEVEASLLAGCDVLVLDPPRAGVSGSVVQKILDARPRRILYLSCNPVTQARDLMLLHGKYRVLSFQGFDFYPMTPHVESLLVLELR